MRPRRESQMPPAIRAIQVKSVGMRKDRGIAIGGAEHAIHRIVRGEIDAPCHSNGVMTWRVAD